MKIARYLSLLIAMLLCLAFVPASAETMHVATSNVLPDMLVGIDDDELFVGFAEQKFYGYERMTFGLARENLDAKQKAIFDALKTVSTQVANGEKKTTSFNLDTKQWATVPQYQCSTTNEAQLAFQADFDIALDALLFDCPYEMYWYDKVSGVRYAYGLGQTGNDYTITSLNIDMYVGAPYAGATAFTVNDIPAKVNTAADKAASIVAENQYVNDFQKLAAYKNAICELVAYDHDAANAGDAYFSNTSVDPWQLISVFDGDNDTNVVCEGYSKAFQYLCDLSDFDGDINVITVTGYMSGGTGAGPHMWNVVTMDDGKNYIVDVTNSEEGTVGQDGQFMLGGTVNHLSAYDPTPDKNDTWGETYQFVCNPKQTMYFTYDANLPYTADQLKLASAPYNYTNVAYVADVNGTKYEVFSHALNAWMGSGTTTLTLLKDIELTEVVKLDTYYGDKVLDLNGHQLSRTDGSIVLYITTGSVNLTIQDSAGNGKIVATADRANLIDSTGKLTITGGTFEAGNGIAIANYGTLHISGNTVISNTSEKFACILYPTSISGNVQINANIDIGIKYAPDLKNATNCLGWVVKNSGDNTATLYADEWLPNGYALQINSKIDYELDEDATGTIVKHDTCTFSDWGIDEDEGYHWKGCDCGRIEAYGPHVYTASYSNNEDGTHTAACACGATVKKNHTMDSATGKCVCGADMAVASVTIDGTTTLYATLNDALTAAEGQTATVTLLADCEISSEVIFKSSSSNVTLELNGKTITSSAELDVASNAKLSIEGSGTFISGNDDIVLLRVGGSLNISGGNFTTTGNNACPIGFDIRGQVKISGNPTFSSSDRSEFSTTVNNVLDLRNATPPTSNGWRVQCWDPNGMAVDTTLILPNGYAMQNADGNIVTRLGYEEVGTIVKHDEHTYVDGKCGCGEVCDHNFILDDGTCVYCKLHFVADVSINDSPATHYATLKDALNAAKGQTATISLLADCVLDEPFSFTSGSNVTLELYGKTITGTARNDDKRSGSLAVDTGATLTIEGEGKYTYTNNGYAGIAVEGTLNIQSGTFEATQNQARVLHAKKGGEINISGGTFIVNNAFACNVQTDGAVNISGTPKFTVPADNTTAYEFGIGKNGKLNLAKVTGNVVEGLRVVSWDNGVAVGPDANIILPDNYVLQDADGNIITSLDDEEKGIIVKHTHAAKNYTDNEDGTHKVTCACGYVLESKATHTYTEEERVWKCLCGEIAVADVDSKKYTDFADAVAAWQVSTAKKLTLLADVQTSYIELTTDNGNQKVLELNGWQLKLTTRTALTNHISLTIQDSSETGTGSLNNNLLHATLVTNHGELNITGGTFEVTASGAYVIVNKGTLCISGVTKLKNKIFNSAVIAEGPTTISGNVQIEADTAIRCNGAVDVSGANNCVGWTVTNYGGTLKLPAETALLVGDKLVQELEYSQRGTIEKHIHAAENYTDNEDGTHKVTCACGYVLGINAPHTYTEVEDRVWECPCGAIAVADVDGKKYTDFEEAVYEWQQISAKNLTLLADVEREYRTDVGGNGALPKVLDLNGYTWRMAGDFYVLRVFSDLTIKNTAESKTGVIEQPTSHSYAINTDVGSSLKIIGNVQISAEMDINYEGAVDLSKATNCIDWYVYNSGNDSTLTLPPNTALERFVGDLVQELQCYESGTIVQHNHSYTNNDHDEYKHWKVCVCGATNSVEDHNYTNANNATHHWTACTCGVTTAQVAHDFKYVDNQDGKTHKVSCDCGYEKASVNHDISTGECVCGAKVVADVDSVKFVNFADAVAAWKAPTTKKLTLLDNVEYGNVISLESDEAKTLDLNAKTLTSTTSANYALDSYCPLTIDDSSTAGTGKFVADKVRECVVYCNGSTLTLNGGTITMNRTSFVLVLNGTTTTINSDNVKLSSNLAAIKIVNRSNLIINGNGCDGWKIWNDSGNPSPIQIPNGFHLEDEAGNMLETNDELPINKYTVIKVDHIHNWSYAANDTADTITATCDAAGCPKPQQSMTLVAPVNLVYDGTAKTVTIDGSIEGVQMPSINITGDTTNVTEEGCTATITVAGETATLSFKIVPASIAEATVSAEDQTYTGKAITPDEVTVILDNKNLTLNTDYTVAYADNVNVGKATITVTGKGNYTGTATGVFNIKAASIEASQITVADQIYTGEELETTVIVILGDKELTLNTDYTLAYEDNRDVGMAKVTINGMGNYTGTVERTFTISLSGSALTAEAEAEYTYGDKITVTGTITATGEVPEQQSNKLRWAAPSVTLFCGETELGSAVVNGNTYTIEYDTTVKLLPIGTHTLTVKYSGSKNLADATATVTVSLMKAAPEYKVPAELTAVYGQTLATVTLSAGWTWNESMNAVGNVGVNSHKATFTPEDTNFYTTAEEEIAVTVKPLPITDVTGPETKLLDVFCPTVEEIIAQLPTTLPGIGSDGQKYDIPVEWSFAGDEFNDDPEAENNFTWTAQSGDPFEIPENAAGTTVVKNGSAMEVTITGENKNITYDGSTYNVSEMFIIDTNAGTAAYAITGGDGNGTLEGSVLTITKAGTFTIQVTTQTNVKDGMPYAPGEATAILTVSKGVPAYTVPTGLTATYGQTLQEISLNGFAGWTWKETTTKVGDAGDNTHTAVFTPENTDLWNTAEADVIITVAKADIQLAGVVKTFLVTEEGETETAVFTYGDTITVKAAPVMPVMMALADEMAMPQPNQMALYCGSKQISAPADAVEGLYTLTYQTTDKALAAGENEILVKYIGTDNLNSGMMSLNVTINPAELSIADVAVKNRPYMQGNLFVEVTKVDLAGKKLDTDDVAADLIGLQASVESDAVGKYAEVVLAEKISLKGADASFYTVKGGVAIKLPEGTEAEITKAKPEPEGTPDMGNVAPGNQLGDVPTDPIEDLFDVPGNVTWNDPADTPVEPGKEYEWTFTPEDDENYEPVTGSTVLVPVAPPQPPVPPYDPVDLPQIIWPAQDQFVTLNNGDTVTMPVSAINADRYQWFVNRNDGTGYVPVSGANTASLTITVNDKDNGNVYLCRVGNANGTVMSPVFHLEVLPAVDVPPTGDTVNTMLWAALLMLSAAGLLLVRKIKVNLG